MGRISNGCPKQTHEADFQKFLANNSDFAGREGFRFPEEPPKEPKEESGPLKLKLVELETDVNAAEHRTADFSVSTTTTTTVVASSSGTTRDD